MTTTTVTRGLGRYRLESRLGAGGMAEVFRATDPLLGRAVAIKLVRAGAASNEFLRRFRREARVLAALDHPGIVPIYDIGADDGRPFFVMPYMAGGTLADRLAEGAIAPHQAVAWIATLAAALDAAHEVGILHRDIKPQNVLLDEAGGVRLADFGLATAGEATRLTDAGLMVGTPLYLAPEIALGCPAGPESDRYALAVTAFELLAGRPPFHGDEPLSVIHQHVHAAPPPLPAWVGPAHARLDRVFARALAKRPEERPLSCRAFAAELQAALANPENAEAYGTPPGDRPGTAAALRRRAARHGSRSVPWLVGTLLVALAALLLSLATGR